MFALLPTLALLAIPALAQNSSSTTASETDIEAIEAHFKQAELVPQLIEEFDPEAILTVSFGGSAISPGDKLDKDAVASSPEITVTPESADSDDFQAGKLYTVLMADANAVGTDQNVTEQTRHWLVNSVGISGDSAPYALNYTGATTITDYAGPGPFEGTGSHRYVIALYEQGDDFSAPSNLSTAGVALGTWFLKSYVSEAKLGDLLAANYFQVENGQATSTAESTTPVDSATLSQAASTTGSGSAAASQTSGASAAASAAGSAGGSATSAAASAAATSTQSGAGKTGVAVDMIMGAVGVVSALVARFQTAANRDAEATARENRRASLQPGTGTGTLGNSRRISSSGLWSASPSPSPGTTPRLGDSTTLPSVEGTASASVQNKSDGTEDIPNDDTSTLDSKIDNLDIKEQTTPEKQKAKPSPAPVEIKEIYDINTSSSPSRPPKSPKRLSTAGEDVNGMTALPVPVAPLSETPKQPDVEEPNKTAKSNDSPAKKKGGDIIQEPISITAKPTTTSTPTKKPSSSSIGSATKKTSSSSSATTKTPLPTSTSTSKSSATTIPRSRLSTGPAPSTTTPARARTSLGHQSTTSSSASKRPPSTAIPPVGRTHKPLVPSHTGPTHRTPSSENQSHTVPSPLKPHLTGTPSKPTASSLAKARIPSGPLSSPGSSRGKRESLSLGRSNGRNSIGEEKGRSSPASGESKDTSTPSKTSSTGQGTGSRLLQGTAASRARSAGVQHHESPSKTASTPVKNSTPKTTSTKSTGTPSTSSTRTPITTTRAKTPASSTSAPRVRVRPQAQNSDTPSKGTNTHIHEAKTPAVGKLPIGRLGLAAAGMKRPEGPMSEVGEKAREEGKIGGIDQKISGQAEKDEDGLEILKDDDHHEPEEPEKAAEEELRELTESVLKSGPPEDDGAEGEDASGEKAQRDPVDRPRTPSPTREIEKENGATPEKVSDSSGTLDVNINKEKENWDQDGKVEVGDESLEEIPDIE
ncbi:hypothetical protein L486_02533 [Kwoniella mangroviensis CBS 10435]|uniref:Uncharacterized protein n=1 Tax=Kwoniella mangroviensis CBS 10435 TaxID=1331196 RepID=A0A1B9IWE7_9TREE|nr:hypothetical protein L486_02533 [Kwoniella mangroviensis CBS 10435]